MPNRSRLPRRARTLRTAQLPQLQSQLQANQIEIKNREQMIAELSQESMNTRLD